jgi:hypothetical protein
MMAPATSAVPPCQARRLPLCPNITVAVQPPWRRQRAQAETEAAPIRYVAGLIGAGIDSERAIRWLIALMVLCCDPLTAAASARRVYS